MALKYEIETLDGLDDATKALYKESGGKFVLAIEGLPKPDAGDLATRLQKLEDNNKALLEEKRKAKEDAEKARLDAAKAAGNLDDFEKSLTAKHQTEIAAKMAEVDQWRGMVSGLTVGQTATQIAAEVFGEHAEVMMPHVRSRISFEVADGAPKVRVMDAAGKLSAASIDDLKTELKADKRFASFAIGSRGSGGGQPGNKGTPSGKKFNEMSGAELSELRKANPAEYDRLKGERDNA